MVKYIVDVNSLPAYCVYTMSISMMHDVILHRLDLDVTFSTFRSRCEVNPVDIQCHNNVVSTSPDATTSLRRRNDVVAMLCVCWAIN